MRISISSPLVLPSPNGRRVAIRIVAFDACSDFTRVTICASSSGEIGLTLPTCWSWAQKKRNGSAPAAPPFLSHPQQPFAPDLLSRFRARDQAMKIGSSQLVLLRHSRGLPQPKCSPKNTQLNTLSTFSIFTGETPLLTPHPTHYHFTTSIRVCSTHSHD